MSAALMSIVEFLRVSAALLSLGTALVQAALLVWGLRALADIADGFGPPTESRVGAMRRKARNGIRRFFLDD